MLQILEPQTRAQAIGKIDQLQPLVATLNLDSLRLLDTRAAWTSDYFEATHLYDGPLQPGWAVITVRVIIENDVSYIRGIHVNVLTDKEYHVNDFSFAGKGLLHFIVLLYAGIVVLTTILGMFLCLKSSAKRKWLWILGMVLSLPTVTFNWSTAALGLNLFNFTFFGFGVFRYPLIGPWTVTTSIPVVAIWFLVKWYRSRTGVVPEPLQTADQVGVAP